MVVSGNSSAPGVSVASRLLALIGAFDDSHRRLSLSELARRAGVSLPTAHRLVGELVGWGAVVRTGTGDYVVGRRLWDIGLLAPVQTDLLQVAAPFLQDIYAATLATVHLAVREGDQVLYVDRLSGTASLRIVSTIGSRLPLHATAVGKVLLAHAPPEVQASVLGSLTRVTPYTVIQPGRLNEQLRQVRERGFAQTVEEMSLGNCSVAVPIVVQHREDADDRSGAARSGAARSGAARSGADLGGGAEGGSVVAALGIVVPSLVRNRSRLVAVLQVAAAGIGRHLR